MTKSTPPGGGWAVAFVFGFGLGPPYLVFWLTFQPMVWKIAIRGRERLESGLVDYNANVEATQQELQLGGCSGQETTVKYRKAWKIGMRACGTTGIANKCAMLLSKGGGGKLLDVVTGWGGGGGRFPIYFPLCEDTHGWQNESTAQKAPCDKVRSTLKQM